MVIVHEFGHFYTAKKFDIRVDEFGFGFPPKLFGKKYGETEYTFNLLPLGGFVKIFGENPNEENISGPDSERSFVNKPRWQQAIVLFGGVFANFLLAWLLFSIGFISGMPTSVDAGEKNYALKDVNVVIISVLPNSPADKALLQTGDKIIALKDNVTKLSTLTTEGVREFIQTRPGKEVILSYDRKGEAREAKLTPVRSGLENTPIIGISMDEIGIAKLPFLKAIREGMALTLKITKETVFGLYGLIRDAILGRGNLDGVTGPVGLVNIVGDVYEFGFSYLLSFTALISVNLAVINFVPFPALDGGRLLFLLVEKIRGSRINPKVFNTANAVGFGLLILLMILVTISDIGNL